MYKFLVLYGHTWICDTRAYRWRGTNTSIFESISSSGVQVLLQILRRYEHLQSINFQSHLFSSKKQISSWDADTLRQLFNIQMGNWESLYFFFLISIGRRRRNKLQFIVDPIWKKLNKWKEKFLFFVCVRFWSRRLFQPS